MPGSVVDLAIPGTRFPDPIAIDSNLLVERLAVPFLGALPRYATVHAQRVEQFFLELAAAGGTGIVTPTVFSEFVHVAIRIKYQLEFNHLSPTARRGSGRLLRGWHDLYKRDATILQAFQPVLDQFRAALIANNMLFLAPDELGPIPSGRTYDEELIHLVGTYGLDSNDAAILMEAQRCGVMDIATLDVDMQRAQQDFNIYTWI